MAVLRSFEKVFGRVRAVVPVTVSGTYKPSGQPDPTEGAAVGVFLVDSNGVPYTASGGGGGGNTTVTATAAAPTYVEGSTNNPLSSNLTGDLRVIAKQSGSWTVAATQSGTWNITNITGTVSLPTGATTSTAQGLISATPYTGTGDGTQISIAKGIYGLLATPATQLPKTPLLNPSDLTYVFNSSSATTTRSLVAAVASQTTRGYRMAVTAAGATTLNFTDGSGGTVLYTFEFPAAGAYVLDLDSRAYFATSANTALHVISSAAVKTTVALYYLTSV